MKLSRRVGVTVAALSILSLGLAACTAADPEAPAAQPDAPAAEAEYRSDSHMDYSDWDLSTVDPAVIERGFFLLPEWHALFPEDKALMDEVVAALSQPATQIEVELDAPIKIAMMFPSLEISDAFARLQASIEGHLTASGIDYEIQEFFINSGEHEMQATQIDEVIANADLYDYVVIGPSEYLVQKANMARLNAVVPTIVTNVSNPFPDYVGTPEMPLTTAGFDSALGGTILVEWTLENVGSSGNFALQRYLPGLLDTLRSDTYADGLVEAGWTLVDEYVGNGDQELSFTGSNAMLTANPELDLIHNGSTAGALGTLAALAGRGLMDEIVTNGWGGGQDELDSILRGELDFTLFRVNDDWGASVAEAIKRHLEGKSVPLVLAPSMKVIDKSFSAEQVKVETDYAFRYSGVLER